MLDVAFYEVFDEEKKELKRFLDPQITCEFFSETTQQGKHEKTPARLISTRTQSIVPAEWARDLDGVLTRSQGYDHLLSFAKKHNEQVALGYLSCYCARSVAEHAVLSAGILLRNFKKQTKQFPQFRRDGITGNEIKGKNALVVGVGSIGMEIVDIVKGLRMNVKGVDIDQKQDACEYVSLEEGLGWTDVLFCALPLTEKTRGMLDLSMLKRIKPGSVLINVSRGEITPIKDVKKLIEQGVLSGVGLDVYENEGILADKLRGNQKDLSVTEKIIIELGERENCLFTPHNAFNTHEATENKAKLSAEAVQTFLKKKVFPDNVPLA